MRVVLGDFPADFIVDNVFKDINGIRPKIQDDWDGVQTLALQTDKSPSLQIFSALPEVECIARFSGEIKGT